MTVRSFSAYENQTAPEPVLRRAAQPAPTVPPRVRQTALCLCRSPRFSVRRDVSQSSWNQAATISLGSFEPNRRNAYLVEPTAEPPGSVRDVHDVRNNCSRWRAAAFVRRLSSPCNWCTEYDPTDGAIRADLRGVPSTRGEPHRMVSRACWTCHCSAAHFRVCLPDAKAAEENDRRRTDVGLVGKLALPGLFETARSESPRTRRCSPP